MYIRLVWLFWTILSVQAATHTYEDTADFNSSFTPTHIKFLQQETKQLWIHGWEQYLQHGFPFDEVRPITCEPYGPNFKDKTDINRNDVMGNVSSTLLDNLDTLIIMEEWDHLETSLQYVKAHQHDLFEKDVIVQVFEMTIRSLGGLLSSHLLLSDVSIDNDKFRSIRTNYDGFLLDLAYLLGKKLIQAFKTSTNIPVPRTNLLKGVSNVPYKLQVETCTSGATTPVLEFTLLSKLTGDSEFEYYSQMTFWKIWSSRLTLDLLPMTILPIESAWKDSISGIGASIDSFYEYAVKFSILFNDSSMWEVFKKSYRALMTHLAKGTIDKFSSLIFANVGFEDGLDSTIWIDSLSAFWAGVQVLAGQVKDAIGSHMVYLKLWDHYDLIPERWNCLLPKNKFRSNVNPLENIIGLEWYPLRPEFIESTYYLYRATRDPMYLQIGERVLNLFKHKYKTVCGFMGFQNIRTGEFQNRMESFVLSETLKYLYLLFDEKEQVFLHDSRKMNNKNWIFSTEGHPLWFNKSLKPSKRYTTNNPKRQELMKLYKENERGLLSSIRTKFKTTKKLTDNVNKQMVKTHDHEDFEDPFEVKFSMCETNPFKSNKTEEFLKSNYYDMDNLFNLDYEYKKYLQQPGYRNLDPLLENGYIELTNDFFQKFTMFPTKLQCPLQPNTHRFDLFLGDKSNIKQREVMKFRTSNHYYLSEFKDLRMMLELLRIDQVDSRYQFITESYMQAGNQDIFDYMNDSDSEALIHHNGDSLIRILKVNGVYLTDPGAIVYIDWFSTVSPTDGSVPGLFIVNDRLLINGYLVENIRII